MIRIACSDSEASCLIASLITEIAMPCPCEVARFASAGPGRTARLRRCASWAAACTKSKGQRLKPLLLSAKEGACIE